MSDLGKQVRTEIGGHLHRLRASLGWTLTDVAEKASIDGIPISASTISRVERGLTAIPAEAMSGLCRSLGTSLSYVEEIVRTASTREQIDLSGRDDRSLLDEGRSRAQAGDVRGALVLLAAAHDWLLMQDGLSDGDERLAEVLTWESTCYRRLHSFTMALNTAGRILNMHGVSEDAKLHAISLHVEVGYITGDFYRASIFAQHARDLLDTVQTRTRARAEMVLGMLEFEQDHFEAAIPWIEAAKALYLELDLEIEVARGLVTLGYCHHRLGRPNGGRKLIQKGRASAEKHGFEEVLAYALRMEGSLLADQGHLSAAEQLLGRSADIARRLTLSTQEFSAWFALYEAARRGRQSDLARRLSRRLTRLLRRVTHQVPEVQKFLAIEAPTQTSRRRIS